MRLYGEWSVTLPGETYVWAPDDTTLGECLLIESELDDTFDEWVAGIDARRAVPCQVLIWFLRRKAGRQEDRLSVDFPIRRLELAHVPVDDPKGPASTDATSPSSPASTVSDPGN